MQRLRDPKSSNSALTLRTRAPAAECRQKGVSKGQAAQ